MHTIHSLPAETTNASICYQLSYDQLCTYVWKDASAQDPLASDWRPWSYACWPVVTLSWFIGNWSNISTMKSQIHHGNKSLMEAGTFRGGVTWIFESGITVISPASSDP